MVTKIITFAVLVIQVVNSQRLIAPINYPPLLTEVLDRCNQPIPSLSPAESDTLCKTFAASIQNIILDKFAQNCLRQPVFGQIAGPLINEISTNLCKCPLCSAVNLTPNSYSKTYISPAVVSNMIKNANGCNVPNNIVNIPVNNLVNSVPVNNLVNSVPVNNLVNGFPVNNVPANFIPNNVNLNNVRPNVNNVQITDLLSLLAGVKNECPCRNPGVL